MKLTPAQQKLFDAHQDLVAKAVSRYGYDCNRDDLRQECRMALMRAARTYDKESRVPFGAYAWKCLRNATMSFFRKQNEIRKTESSGDEIKDHGEVLGYDEKGALYEGITKFDKAENKAARKAMLYKDETDDEEYGRRIAAVREMVSASNSPLTELESRSLMLVLEYGFEHLPSIARLLKSTPSAIRHAIDRAKKKLQQNGQDRAA